jgi:hypothetical protein
MLWWYASRAPEPRQPTTLHNIENESLPKLLGTMLSVASSSTATNGLSPRLTQPFSLPFSFFAFLLYSSHDSLRELYANLREFTTFVYPLSCISIDIDRPIASLDTRLCQRAR